MLKKVIKAEWMKARHSFLPWMVILGGLFIPVVEGLIYLFRWASFVPEAGANGWDTLLSTCMGLSAGLLFPFLVILMVAFNHHVEYKANAWKRLLVIPLGRTALYGGKWLFLLLGLLVATLIQAAGIVLVGLLLGWLKPALALQLTGLPFGFLTLYTLRFYITFFAILTIQFVLNVLINNTLVTVVVGVFAYVLSMVLVQGWAYAVYDPYALPMLIDWENATRTPMFQWMGLYKPEWLSLLYSVLIAWGGLAFFKRVPVR